MRVLVSIQVTGQWLPLIVSVTEGPDGDGEGLPHWVQRVLHYFSLVADSKPGDRQRFKIPKLKNQRCCETVLRCIYPDGTEY